ncbi:MAG: hypothetical protein ACK56I_17535, partial [bacterium]
PNSLPVVMQPEAQPSLVHVKGPAVRHEEVSGPFGLAVGRRVPRVRPLLPLLLLHLLLHLLHLQPRLRGVGAPLLRLKSQRLF